VRFVFFALERLGYSDCGLFGTFLGAVFGRSAGQRGVVLAQGFGKNCGLKAGCFAVYAGYCFKSLSKIIA
jgi:hypothetical protein